MKTTVFKVALLVVLGAAPALACSGHSGAAAGMINSWLGGQGNGGGWNATGQDNGANWGLFNAGAGFVHDSYVVTITGPNGETITVTGTSTTNHMSNTVTSNGVTYGTTTNGGDLEYALRDAAIAILGSYLTPPAPPAPPPPPAVVVGDDLVG